MKVFHVKRKDSVGYDEWDEFVCIASSESRALKMHPNGRYIWKSKKLGFIDEEGQWAGDDHGWVNNLDHLEITLLGGALAGFRAGIVCVSFNAG